MKVDHTLSTLNVNAFLAAPAFTYDSTLAVTAQAKRSMITLPAGVFNDKNGPLSGYAVYLKSGGKFIQLKAKKLEAKEVWFTFLCFRDDNGMTRGFYHF